MQPASMTIRSSGSQSFDAALRLLTHSCKDLISQIVDGDDDSTSIFVIVYGDQHSPPAIMLFQLFFCV
jgi:hypothetical protein